MKLLNVDSLSGTALTAELVRRPLLLVFIGLASGISAPIAPGSILVFAAFLIRLRALKPWICLVLPFLVGLWLSPQPVPVVDSETFVTLRGRVGSIPAEGSYGFRCRFVSKNGVFLLSGPGVAPTHYGEEIEVRAVLRPFSDETIAIYRQRGMQGKLQADLGGITILEQAPWILRVSDTVRQSFKQFLEHSLHPREAALAGALCMSLNGDLESETMDSLKITGTIHLISTSGLHFMFLSLALFGIFSVTPLPRPVVWGIVAAIMLVYGLSVGLHPPVARSICVILLAKSATFFRRESDLWSALALVGVGYLLTDPRVLFEIGFQLSFLTVAFFGIVGREGGDRWKDRLKGEAKSTGVAFLATLPIIAYYQGYIGLTAPLANLLLVFVLPWILLGSFLSFALSTVLNEPAMTLMKFLVEPLIGWVEAVLRWTGIQDAQVGIPAFSGYLLVLVYGLVLISWRRKRVEA